jgi:hypothetical protein
MYNKVKEMLRANRIRYVETTLEGRKILTDITPYGSCSNNELKQYVLFRKAKDTISEFIKETKFKLIVDGWEDKGVHCHWLTIAR